MLRFWVVCSLFGLFCCSDTNTPRPCSTGAIGGRHRLTLPLKSQWWRSCSAFPQSLFRTHCPVSIRYTWPIKPAKPTHPSHSWTNTPSAVRQSHIFHQINSPSKPFSNQHANSCEPVPSFLNRLPAPIRHFWTYTPSAVSQYHLFHQITCPSKPFSNQNAKCCDPVPSFLIRSPDPTIYF